MRAKKITGYIHPYLIYLSLSIISSVVLANDEARKLERFNNFLGPYDFENSLKLSGCMDSLELLRCLVVSGSTMIESNVIHVLDGIADNEQTSLNELMNILHQGAHIDPGAAQWLMQGYGRYFNLLTTTMISNIPELLPIPSTITPFTGRAPVRIALRKEFACKFCSKSYDMLGPLNTHMRIHTGIKPHQCRTCGKKFVYIGDLNRHIGIHDQVKRFKCHICFKGFNQKGNLKTHLVDNHEKNRPRFKCNNCPKSYKNERTLKQGLCPYCRKGKTHQYKYQPPGTVRAGRRGHLGLDKGGLLEGIAGMGSY